MQDYELFTTYLKYVSKAESLIRRELLRQLDLQQAGKFRHIAFDRGCDDMMRLAMLMEEVGEVGRAMQVCGWKNLKEELVQVAAVATSWVARLDENGID